MTTNRKLSINQKAFHVYNGASMPCNSVCSISLDYETDAVWIELENPNGSYYKIKVFANDYDDEKEIRSKLSEISNHFISLMATDTNHLLYKKQPRTL